MSLAFTGLLSSGYFALFWFVYRDPKEDRLLTLAEHEHILEGGGEFHPYRRIAGCIAMVFCTTQEGLGLALGMAAYNYNLSFSDSAPHFTWTCCIQGFTRRFRGWPRR